MNTSKAIDIVKTILADLGIPEESLHNDTLLYEDLQLDSTEIVELALGLKQHLGISLKLESRQDMTIDQVSDKVKAALLTKSSDHGGI